MSGCGRPPRVLLAGHNPYVPENMSQGTLAVYPLLPIVIAAPFTFSCWE